MMQFDALKIEDPGVAKIGGTISFSIPVGHEATAAQELHACLNAGFEVQLRNDLDEGLEGYSLFRRTPSGLEFKVGGHGWSGSWKPLDEASFTATIAELAPHNRGGHWSLLGSLSRT